MATKVIPGTSTDAAKFVSSRFSDLCRLSVLPLVAATTLNIAAIFVELQKVQSATVTAQTGYGFIDAVGQLLSITTFVIGAWWFVRQVILRSGAGVPTFGFAAGELKNTVFVSLYGVGMAALLLAPVFALDYLALGRDTDSTAFLKHPASFIPAFVYSFLILPWVGFRFLAALPGVATGWRPNFIKDIWKLSDGESWALPARFFAWGILAALFVALLYGLLGGFNYMGSILKSNAVNDPAVMREIQLGALNWSLLITPLVAVVLAPITWFFTGLLNEAFLRFQRRANL